MEQKQLDEMEESFLDEEFISEEDLVAEPKKEQKSSVLPPAEPSGEQKSGSSGLKKNTPAVKITPVKAERKEMEKTEKKESKAERKVQVHEMRPEPKSKAPLKPEPFSSPLSKEPVVKKESKELSGKEAVQKEVPLPGKEKDNKPKPAEKSASSPSSFSSSPPVNPWANENGSGTLKSVSTWKAMTGIVLVLLLFSVFTDGFQFGGVTLSSEEVVLPREEIEQKVLDFVNTNLLRPPFVAEVKSSEDVGSLYKFTLAVAGQEVDSYATKDGEFFFPQGLALAGPVVPSALEEEKDVPVIEVANEAGETVNAVAEESGPSQEVPAATITGAAVGVAPQEAAAMNVAEDPFLGDANAPVTIVEFSDYRCPFCRKFWSETLPKLKEGYIATGIVKYVFKDYPLPIHPEARPAALAAACARKQGKFWEYHDQLFKMQSDLGEHQYLQWAEELGLNVEQFADCVRNEKYAAEIEADIQEGRKLGIDGTPVFFVNGKMLGGAQPYSIFVDRIEAALAASGNAKEASATGPSEVATAETETAPEVAEEAPSEAAPAATETSAPPADEPQDVIITSISAKRWLFGPNKLTFRKGDEVLLSIVPEGGLQFMFSIPAFGVEEEVAGNTQVRFVVDKAGEFPFSCSSCESWRGMTGKVVVKVD